MGAGNRSQGRMYWRKAVEYKLANKAKDDVIDSRRSGILAAVERYDQNEIACRSRSSRLPSEPGGLRTWELQW